MKKIIQTIEKLFGVYRWHPTIALRYLPIIDALKKADLGTFTILEVGSGSLGIAPYIKQKVIGIDLDFSAPYSKDLVGVKGNALTLPFVDNSFDVVISTDMLEHIKSSSRKQAIKEMTRVAKHFICIGVPCGKKAQAQDAELSQMYVRTRGQKFNFFEEHSINGLPEASEIKQLIISSAHELKKDMTLKEKGTLNLRLRYILMRGWISTNTIISIIFRKGLLFLVPIMRRINHNPTYRHLFFVTIKK